MLHRILIVDDAEDIEFLVRFCVNAYWPDAVLEMYDPRCGIPEKTFNWSRYDLLLLDYDLNLPDQNGIDWLRELIKDDHLPPVIIMTGYATDKLSNMANSEGADGFLDKNKLTPETFANLVRSVIENPSRIRQELSADNKAEKTQLLKAVDKQKIIQKAKIDSPTTQDFEKTRLITNEEVPASISPPDNVQANNNVLQTATQNKPVLRESSTTTARRITSSISSKIGQPESITITVPGYIIQSKIGEGGMASIYLAEREEDNIKVVLKILNLKDQGDSNLLRRFMREYKLIAQIQHPNIVEIYERAFASDFAYIAMEYFGYGDLAERLKKGLDSHTAIDFLHQITEGLGAAHAKGIVHRDMKPANILFRSETSLAITDFGIAKAVESQQMKKQLTMDGELMGTLYYISPEQIMGGEADQRSDLYSLGVIMYKMLTGNHPYVGSNPTEIFEGHLNSPIPLLPEKFAALQPLLDGLLAKDPDERFQSTEDLLLGLNWKEWT